MGQSKRCKREKKEGAKVNYYNGQYLSPEPMRNNNLKDASHKFVTAVNSFHLLSSALLLSTEVSVSSAGEGEGKAEVKCEFVRNISCNEMAHSM